MVAPEEVTFGEMNVTDGFERALTHTRQLLFDRFNFGVWICLAFGAFLESPFGPGGGGGGGSSSGGTSFKLPDGLPEAPDAAGDILSRVVGAPLYFGLAVVGFLAVVALGLLYTWLTSRGTMMFLRSCATGRSAVGESWNAVTRPAWSLFLFQLVLYAVLLLVFGVGGGGLALVSGGFTSFEGPALIAVIFAVVSSLVFGLGFAVVSCLLRNIVAPIMWKFDISCVEGWQLFFRFAGANVGQLILFVVLRVALAFGIAVVAFFVGLFTCCVGFLPFVSHCLLLPLLVFERTYSLTVVESLGEDFRMISAKASCQEPSDEPIPPTRPSEPPDSSQT